LTRFGSTPFNASDIGDADDASKDPSTASSNFTNEISDDDPSTASSTFANEISDTSAGDKIVSAVIELRLPETRFKY